MIGDRLTKERKRLGYNQENLAAIAGVSRRTFADWEAGNTSPTAVQLAALHAVGVDVLYVITNISAGVVTNRPDVVDVALVVKIAAQVETALTKLRARISIEKKEELVRLFYEHFALKGRVEEETIERHLKLVVNQ